jgi:hypothetical protein
VPDRLVRDDTVVVLARYCNRLRLEAFDNGFTQLAASGLWLNSSPILKSLGFIPLGGSPVVARLLRLSAIKRSGVMGFRSVGLSLEINGSSRAT